MVDVRPMTLADVEGVLAVVQAANDDADRRAGREPQPPSDEDRAFSRRGMQRFIERDPDGAWVATHGDTVVGMTEAIRRGSFWGLSMLFVDPGWQSKGVGRLLLEATRPYAQGAQVRMIMSSADPRAMRRYSREGLAMHPAAEVEGVVDRQRIPADLPGREGTPADLELVAAVDSALRGSRAEDVEFLLGGSARMDVIDTGGRRGFVVGRGHRLAMLGATDDETATLLLWRHLAQIDGKASIWALTAAQDWAIRVALDAGLAVRSSGAMFVDGMRHLPGPWLPSGWYF
jgi:GNAT superfamily N-acetyltransferase